VNSMTAPGELGAIDMTQSPSEVTTATRPALPSYNTVIHETDTGLYRRWNGIEWVLTRLTAGDVCQGYEPGVPIFLPCRDCHHLWVLHTRDVRGCAACEAIAEAMKAARALGEP